MSYSITYDEKGTGFYSSKRSDYADAPISTSTIFKLAPGISNAAYGFLDVVNSVADSDAYDLGFLAVGKYTIKAQGYLWFFGTPDYASYITPTIRIYDASGNQLSSNLGTVDFFVSTPGTYFVGVSGVSYQQSQYQLSYTYIPFTNTPDNTPPVLTSLTIPTTIDLKNGAAPLVISAIANDPGSGINKIVYRLDKNLTYDVNTGGGTHDFLGNFGIYDSWADGVSTQSFLVQNTNQSGIYNVISIDVYDNQGNVAKYDQASLNAIGVNTRFTLINTIPDTTPPVLNSLTIPTTIDLKNGAAPLVISAIANDPGSGINKIVYRLDKTLTYDVNTGGGTHDFLGNFGIYDSWEDGVSTQSFLVQNTNQSGTYNVISIDVYDNQGNVAKYDQASLNAIGVNTKFTLINTTPDTTPPVLTSLTIPTTIDLKNGAAPLVISAIANDPGSGINKIVYRLDKNLTYDVNTGGGTHDFLGNFGIYDSWADGVSTQSFLVIDTNQLGTYNVVSIDVYDNQGNVAKYDQASLNAIGVNTKFTLINTAPDTTPPTLAIVLPSSGATGVAIANDIVLTFSEPVQRGTGNIILKDASGAVIATYDAAISTNVSLNGSTVTINPTADLNYSTGYRVEIASGAIKDLAGNNYSGTTNYTFTTVAPKPNLAPVLSGSPSILRTGLEDVGYSITAVDLLVGWSDPDIGDTLSVTNLNADHGNVNLNAIGAYYITPEPNYNGKVVLSYKVTDGINIVSATQTYNLLPVNDPPTGAVTISGTATQNQTLTASNNLVDVDGTGVIHYQWQANGVDIPNTTSSTFTLTQTEVGKTMSVVASYVDVGGTTESKISSATAPVVNVNDAPIGNVVIVGNVTQNQMLTATNNLVDLDGLGVLHYQWKADGADIPNANASTFTLTQSEVNKSITVAISYVDGGGTAESKASSPTMSVANINDAPTGNVTINGIAKQGQTLTVSNNLSDLDGLGLMHYQWQANGIDITNANTDSHTLTQADVNKIVTVVASYIDGGGTAESKVSAPTSSVAILNNHPTGSVTIAGTLLEGQTIRSINSIVDLDGISSNTKFAYQWSADGNSINGATSNTLLLTHDLAGKSLAVKISYTDDLGTVEVISSNPSVALGGKYVGTIGDNVLTGSRGNDVIDGGAGVDTVIYSGNINNYTITHTGKVYTVNDKSGADGADTLTNVESVKFVDLSINLQVQDIAASAPQANVQRLIELYVAFFNRVPDANGLAYWIGEMKAGQTTNQIAETFYIAGVQYSDLTHFTATMSNADFINVIYKNVLGRNDGADQGGLDYWSAKLVAGTATRGSLVSTILDAAHGFKGDSTWGWVANLLDNKIAVAHTFAIDFGLNYLTPTDSIAHGMAIAAAVTPTDTTVALGLIGISPNDIHLI